MLKIFSSSLFLFSFLSATIDLKHYEIFSSTSNHLITFYFKSPKHEPVRTYELASPFQFNLARVKFKHLFGYIDTNENWVIEPNFEWAWSFEGNAAIFSKSQMLGLINQNGSVLVEPQLTWISEFSCGVAIYKQNALYGYVDEYGKFLMPPKYTALNPFFKDNAPFFDGKNITWLNRQGNWTNAPEWAKPFMIQFSKATNAFQTNAHSKSLK